LLSSPQPSPASSPASVPNTDPAAGSFFLYVQVLGKFVVRYQNQVISLGSNKNGRALFRYLITLPERRAAKDVLLELFWPNDASHRASHKLHIAVSTLRQALDEALHMPQGSESVLFVDDHYALFPDLHVQLDADVFAAHVQVGERLERESKAAEAMVEYEAARALYGGDFLVEDLYADWTIARRARLEELYLTLLGRLGRHYLDEERYAESVSCCRQILARDSFREDAYRHLMRCYSRMGRRNQALREFQACQEVLKRELGVSPMRETVALYEQIAREENV
jgi:DNA-binding SARP family transcriptional activator